MACATKVEQDSAAIISREDAKAAGLVYYHTGVPCRRGHVAERLVNGYHCVVCKQEDHQRRKQTTRLSLTREPETTEPLDLEPVQRSDQRSGETHAETPVVSLAVWTRQKELEAACLAAGAERFRQRLASAEASGAASTVGAARYLLRDSLSALEGAIRAYATRQPGVRSMPVGAKWCALVGPEVAAYLILKIVLDHTGGGAFTPLSKTATTIADLILDELKYRRFKERAPHLFDYKLRALNTVPHSAHKARSMKASMTFAAIDTSDLDLPISKRMLLGSQLIDLLSASSPGLLDVSYTTSRRGFRQMVLSLTDVARQQLADQNAMLELLEPVVTPLVMEPRPWSPRKRGGYYFALRGRYSFVRKASEQYTARAAMPQVYDAVNHLQSTRWRVNTRILETVREIINLNGGFAGIPQGHDEPLPEKPDDFPTNEAAQKRWRDAARVIRNRNHARGVDAAAVARILNAAEKVKDDPTIFFVWNLDFRGRAYPISAYWSPQGCDLERALLLFADIKPVDADAARYLALYGANCFGVTPTGTKVASLTISERVAFIEENTPTILKVADDPLLSAFWLQAEKPLQFLAFAFEWAGYVKATERGEDYFCGLPCHMDGSCNGIQHYSALLADPSAARAVNVLPSDRPQDVYQQIADTVLRTVTEEAEAGDPLAQRWLAMHQRLDIINRSLCKRPTMTFGYGSRRFGFKRQLQAYLLGLDSWQEIEMHFAASSETAQDARKHVSAACVYMARVLWDALRDTVVSSYEAMAWLQRAAKGIRKPIEVVVPGTGFPLQQPYFDKKGSNIITTLAGRTVSPSFYFDTKTVDRRKQVAGLPPNVVHALDAAHLHRTVNACATAGISSFSMVHDSYGTVPADCGTLARALRETFVQMYAERDVVADLYSQLAAQHNDPATCPEPPAKGSLDVSRVIDSLYFFS